MEIDATDKPIEQYLLENSHLLKNKQKKTFNINCEILFAVVSFLRKGTFRQYLIK